MFDLYEPSTWITEDQLRISLSPTLLSELGLFSPFLELKHSLKSISSI